MYGDGEIEMAECDMYGEPVGEFTLDIVKFVWERDQKKKQEFKRVLDSEIIPTYFNKYEKKLEKSKSGFLIGSRLSWVDIALFRSCEGVNDNFINMQEKVFETYPHVKKHFEFIANVPRIAEHLKNRPNYLY